MPHDLSIIIVTHNASEDIVPCMQSIAGQLQGNDTVEFIVVDNASTDSTVEKVRTQFPQVIVIQNNSNVGFAAAVNQGVAASNGSFVLLLNPDTVVQAGFLKKIKQALEVHPEAAIIGCGLKDFAGHRQPSCWKTPGIKSVLLEMFLPYSVSLPMVTESPDTLSQVETVSGACMIIRREVFDRLHGFDTRFFMYYEDFDFCLRARTSGSPVMHEPGAVVMHHLGKSSWKEKQSFFLKIYKSKLIFFRKHYSLPYFGFVSGIIILGLIFKIAVYTLTGCLTLNKELLRLAKYHTFVLLSIPKNLN